MDKYHKEEHFINILRVIVLALSCQFIVFSSELYKIKHLMIKYMK